MTTAKEYSDGHPLDEIGYLEYKILLKPDHFVRPEGYEYYWANVCKVAEKLGVGVKMRKEPFKREVREVLFFDTHKFDLYNNSFILRKRTYYIDGWPEPDHELAFKFRNEDMDMSAGIDVRSNIEGTERIKFKEELLPLRDEVGGMRSIYSHNCILTSPNIVLDQGLSNVAKVFPCLRDVGVKLNSKIDLVNQVRVNEVEVTPGHLDFGHHLKAKATIAIWRNRATETSLVGEFAFQAKFNRYDDVHAKARALADKFFIALQKAAPEWIQLGTTKTYMIYGMGNKAPSNHE
ncbi:hypothetical protein [Rubellicoccus peritrichatus]|uniref:Uncharacterized protein n=1 Tax=Rubellicoccus peritrichatus TaxID=3080537 RepID=A0AAQ3L7Q3_9BACT|nr:hypothetical protein [Puniceicoccus sp. CR14]WOO39399.1 hypothetical protein RZN69_12310 [Puniceicoccus sp. CR14]